MSIRYKHLPKLLLLLLLALSGKAQTPHEFKSLAPYIQNFDGMGTATGANASPVTPTSVPGIVTGYVAQGQTAFTSLTAATANDGSNSNPNVYNFGTTGAPDRALGGIAGGFTGRGYIAARLVNKTGVVLTNLDVRYAFEQWYNSTIAKDARFRVYYRVYPSTGTAFNTSDLTQIVDSAATGHGTWRFVPGLGLSAPATGTVSGQTNGNSNTYRRQQAARISGVNVPNDAEVVICFAYTFSPTNNGNGMAIDDIAIYPEANIVYSNTTGKLSQVTTWFKDSTAKTPAGIQNFAGDNYVYFVQGTNTTTRLSKGWQVTGANTRVVVGLSKASPASLTLVASDTLGTSSKPVTMDVTGGSTLTIVDPLSTSQTSSRPFLTLGSLAAGSTVAYTATAAQNVLPATYYNLNLAGSNSKILLGNVLVSKVLTLAQAVQLGKYDLTLVRGASLVRTTNMQVLADGGGSLRATVPGGGAATVLFPVSITSEKGNCYPVSIKAGPMDRDETYSVRIIDKVYSTYDASGTPSGPASTAQRTISKTWLISRETTASLAATVELGWPSTAQSGAFVPANAYVAHYSVSTGWETVATNSIGTSTSNGQSAAQRTGVSNFSPFSVTSSARGPLPVQLVSFSAQALGAGVACRWATASELNNDHFVVERSQEGTGFVALGRVAGNGTSPHAHTYAFADARPLPGTAYYRLRQVDKDGTSTFSEVVAVTMTMTNPAPLLTVAPNPGTGRFALQATVATPLLVRGQVLNVLGQAVLTVQQALPAGISTFPLDLTAYPAGIYLLRLTGLPTPVTLRLQKQ